MAKQTIATIKKWFVTNAKPVQQQFWDWLDSFRHIDDKIGITDLTAELQNKIGTSGGSAPPDLSGYLKTTDKGVAGGVASLGTDGQVPLSQLPAMGAKGDDGLSAFQLWVAQGNPNSIDLFWQSLTGPAGESAYQSWLDLGNSGAPSDFIAALKGAKGDRGDKGDPGNYQPAQYTGVTSSIPIAASTLVRQIVLVDSSEPNVSIPDIFNAGDYLWDGGVAVLTVDRYYTYSAVLSVTGTTTNTEIRIYYA